MTNILTAIIGGIIGGMLTATLGYLLMLILEKLTASTRLAAHA